MLVLCINSEGRILKLNYNFYFTNRKKQTFYFARTLQVTERNYMLQQMVLVDELILGNLEDVAGVDLSMRTIVGRRTVNHVDVGVHDVTWMLMTCPTMRAKNRVDAKSHQMDSHSPHTLGPGRFASHRVLNLVGACVVRLTCQSI